MNNFSENKKYSVVQRHQHTVRSLRSAMGAGALCFFMVRASLGDDGRAFRNEFLRNCPPPEWWDQVQAPRVETEKELTQLWIRGGQTKENFKAAYQAIADHPADAGLVLHAVSIMPWADMSYPYSQKLREIALQRYFSHRDNLGHGGRYDGDTVAMIVGDLVKGYDKTGRYRDAIRWSERLAREHSDDRGPHTRQLVALSYAEALYRSGQPERAREALQRALHEDGGSWTRAIQYRLGVIDSGEQGSWEEFAVGHPNGAPAEPAPIQPPVVSRAPSGPNLAAPPESCGIALERLAATRVLPGARLKLYGTWGANPETRWPALKRAGIQRLSTVSWSTHEIEIRLPDHLDPGLYQIGVYCKDPLESPSASSGFLDLEIQ